MACLNAVFLLYAAYLGQSRSLGADADGASNVLQAWDMLHGNPLLRGWWLSDVSFYTTELPEHMLVELTLGETCRFELVQCLRVHFDLSCELPALAGAPRGLDDMTAQWVARYARSRP